MNKTMIIVGIACFVLALAGSTAVVVLRSPAKTAAVADSTAVSDSTHATAAHGGTAAPATPGEAAPAEGAVHEGATVALEGEGAVPAAEPDRMALAASVPHEGEVVPSTSTPKEAPADYGRVAKILVNMKPAEAAAILEQLGDPQIEGVLRAVGPRQAATLLAALPTTRAAQLSKRLLVPTPEEKRP